jgi:DNA polymerase
MKSMLTEEGRQFLAYNIQDVLAEAAVAERVPRLPDSELPVWQAHERVNQRGIGVNVQGVDDCIVIVEQCVERYSAELVTITGGAVQTVSQTQKLRAWLDAQGHPLPDLQAETVEAALKSHDEPLGCVLPDHVHRVLELRQILASASVKKLYSMKYRQCDGRLHGLYAYHAARTGRWTAMGPQPQNFPKPLPEFEDFEEVKKALAVISQRSLAALEVAYPAIPALDVIGSCLRSLLQADLGNELICSDFVSIEAVVLACLAGEQWRIDTFREGKGIYEVAGSRLDRIPLEEILAYKKLHGKHHPRRPTWKIAELAGGYGGWINAWRNFGDERPDAEIKADVLAWRRASPNIVEFWGGQTRNKFNRTLQGDWQKARHELFGLEGAAISAVQMPGRAFWVGQIAYQSDGKILYCRLPSGRLIAYHNPQLVPSRSQWADPWELELSFEGWNTNQKKGAVGWVRMGLYGGLTAENVVQAVARDYQAAALLNLEAAGYPPVIHSHDEIAAEVKIGFGSLEEFEEIGSRKLSWAALPDGSPWPVSMRGGWRGFEYRKAA